MELMEIILLAAGGIIFILSFFIPDGKPAAGGTGDSRELAEEEIKTLVSQEISSIREHVDDVVEEAVNYAMEKTERSLERLSNEKIMAVGEYSDTVLKEIHKNHEEAMFLYDMLNSKHINLKNTVSEINRTMKEAEETVMSFQKLAPEAVSVTGGRVLDAYEEPAVKRETERAKPEKSGLERLGTAGRTVEISETKKTGTVRPEITGLETIKPETIKTATVKMESAASGKISFLQDTAEQGRNNNERILELVKKGKSTVAIARELGLGVGEVKLVIDLFKNQ